MTLPKQAIALTGCMTLAALAAITYAASTMNALQDYRWLVLFVLAVATARLKVKLPGLTGNMAVNLPFLLIAVTQLSLMEALLVALPAPRIGESSDKPVKRMIEPTTKFSESFLPLTALDR